MDKGFIFEIHCTLKIVKQINAIFSERQQMCPDNKKNFQMQIKQTKKKFLYLL